MAIKGKKEYKFYLDEESAELVKSFLDRSRNSGGMSGLVDEYIQNVARTLRESSLENGQTLGWSKMFKLFVNGLRNSKYIT